MDSMWKEWGERGQNGQDGDGQENEMGGSSAVER